MEPLTSNIDIQTIKQLIRSTTYHIINIQTVKQLIEANNYHDINKQYGRNRETLLHCAAYHNYFDIVEYLVKSGASIDTYDDCNNTPLHHASLAGNLDIVKYLIKSGANVNLVDINERTPLHSATIDGLDECGYDTANHDESHVCHYQHLNTETVKYLIDSNVPIDSGDDDGNTALHLAARHNIDFVKCLLDNGASAQCKNKDGQTADDVAIARHNPKIAEYIRTYDDIPTKGVHS